MKTNLQYQCSIGVKQLISSPIEMFISEGQMEAIKVEKKSWTFLT